MKPRARIYAGRSYLLFSDYNEKNVFVEDLEKEALYDEILSKLQLSFKVTKVFCLGSKAQVLEHSQKYGDGNNMYIIDGDWDKFKQVTYPDKRVISLSRYSIENYLVVSRAFWGVLQAEFPGKKIEQRKVAKYFKKFGVRYSSDLVCLCRAFFVAQSYFEDSPKNVQLSPGKFQRVPHRGKPCPNKISDYVSGVKKSLSLKEDWDRTEKIMDGHSHLEIIPGKYLLFYFWEYLRRKFGVQGLRQEKLKIRLAQLLDKDDLIELKKELGFVVH